MDQLWRSKWIFLFAETPITFVIEPGMGCYGQEVIIMSIQCKFSCISTEAHDFLP